MAETKTTRNGCSNRKAGLACANRIFSSRRRGDDGLTIVCQGGKFKTRAWADFTLCPGYKPQAKG